MSGTQEQPKLPTSSPQEDPSIPVTETAPDSKDILMKHEKEGAVRAKEEVRSSPPPAKKRAFVPVVTEASPDWRETGLEHEKERAIRTFIGNKEEWFSGDVKLRFEDFVVYEVSLDHETVHLNSKELFNVAHLDNEGNIQIPVEKDPKEEILPILGEEKTTELFKFVEETEAKDKKTAVLVLGVFEDKEKRTQIHKVVKLIPGIRTGSENGQIIAEFNVKKSKFRRNEDWPRDAPKFIEFVLEKTNLDTTKCITDLSSRMKVDTSRFCYAGTKDKRAVTTQRVTAFKITPKKLLEFSTRVRGVSIGNFKARKEALRLGDLYGNRFAIVIRNVRGDEDKIRRSMEHVKEFGFINYYGMQRFGTGKIPSHRVGLAVLKSDWKTVVGLILSSKNRTDTKAALEHYETTGDIKATIKLLRPRTIEQNVLFSLSKDGPTAYYNAFSKLPRNLRTLYTHAYQSFLWNEVASIRIEKYGLEPILGDLVLLSEQPILHNEGEGEAEAEAAAESRAKQKVTLVTKEDIDAKKYTIEDVVLPLPGFDVIYPKNELAGIFKAKIKADGLKHDLRHKNRDYSLSGSYRKIVQKPMDLKWSLEKYENETIPLFQSDSAILAGETPLKVEEGKYTAMKVEMTLHRSTYATMCMREFMKYPTHRQN